MRKITCPCMYCGKFLTKQEATLEHLVKKSNDGSNSKGNLSISCGSCNYKRHNTPIKEWKKIRSKKLIIPDLILFIE